MVGIMFYVLVVILLVVVIYFGSKKVICEHEFHIDDIKRTHIPRPAPPLPDTSYDEWVSYYQSMYDHPSHTQRVVCPCTLCKKDFYAHCGLDLPGKLIGD